MKINVVGMGVMGCQIASLLYLLGYDVAVTTRSGVNEKKMHRSNKILRKFLDVDSNKLGSVRFCKDISDLYDACTIESVAEDLSLKKEIYSCVREITNKPFASNTSSLRPSEIASDVVGLHFFNPIYLKFVEVINNSTNKFPDEIISDLERSNFSIINVEENRGYIGNYLLFHEIGAALKLVDKYGYSSETIKMVYSNLYPNRDIFSILDLIGLDIAQNIFHNLHEEDNSIYLPICIDNAINLGILGRKNKTSILDVLDKNYGEYTK